MMDAVEFTKEARRMCLSHTGTCGVCGAWNCNEKVCKVDYYDDQFDPEEAVRIVEEWSKAHPIQTNGMKLKKDFGLLGVEKVFNAGRWMYALPEQWWNAPYEAPKGAEHD